MNVEAKTYGDLTETISERRNTMSAWRWEHQGDGRVLRLFQGEREVLVIDRTKLQITDMVGVTRFDVTLGEGERPTFEDEKLILDLLNKES